MRSKKLISPHGGLVPILNLMGLYLCRPAGSNLSWWHWYWGWKWGRWDDDKMKAVNQLWNFSCLLDLDSFNLTGCAEFLTLWVSSVLVDMKSKLTIFIFLKLCFQKLSSRDQTSCVSFQTRLVSPHISTYPWSEQYKLKAAIRNKMGSKVLDCTRWDWWIRCTNQDFDQYRRTCISMISGSGFGCKAELGAGGVHLLRLLRRLLRHQPTAVHWESVQGESYVVRFPDPLKSVGESDKEPCSWTRKWQRGYYPERTIIDFHLLARVRS